MKIIVFSDTHGRIEKCVKALEKAKDAELIVHLGDISRDVNDLRILAPQIPIEDVPGNNDFSSTVKYTRIIEAEGKKLLLTHGHNYRVSQSFELLAEEVIRNEADIGLFGHTHVPFDGYELGVHLFNPGSISLPAKGTSTYGIITIYGGEMHTEVKTL